jgi:hypothetical protein
MKKPDGSVPSFRRSNVTEFDLREDDDDFEFGHDDYRLDCRIPFKSSQAHIEHRPILIISVDAIATLIFVFDSAEREVGRTPW